MYSSSHRWASTDTRQVHCRIASSPHCCIACSPHFIVGSQLFETKPHWICRSPMCSFHIALLMDAQLLQSKYRSQTARQLPLNQLQQHACSCHMPRRQDHHLASWHATMCVNMQISHAHGAHARTMHAPHSCRLRPKPLVCPPPRRWLQPKAPLTPAASVFYIFFCFFVLHF